MKIWKIIMTQRGVEAHSACSNYAVGFVIRANYPKQVRVIAMENCGDEGEDIWHDAKYSSLSCIGETTTVFSKKLMILRDFAGS